MVDFHDFNVGRRHAPSRKERAGALKKPGSDNVVEAGDGNADADLRGGTAHKALPAGHTGQKGGGSELMLEGAVLA